MQGERLQDLPLDLILSVGIGFVPENPMLIIPLHIKGEALFRVENFQQHSRISHWECLSRNLVEELFFAPLEVAAISRLSVI